jgi:hypothetical protein
MSDSENTSSVESTNEQEDYLIQRELKMNPVVEVVEESELGSIAEEF